MAQTSAQLVSRVLSDLNAIGLGQDAEAEVSAEVSARITTILAELNARTVIYVQSADSIDDAIFEALVEYMVAKLGPSFGRPETPFMEILLIEDRLKDIKRPAPTKRTLSTDPMLRQGGLGAARNTYWNC
jgi:hypothetical protein